MSYGFFCVCMFFMHRVRTGCVIVMVALFTLKKILIDLQFIHYCFTLLRIHTRVTLKHRKRSETKQPQRIILYAVFI